jgi:2-keto-4-pentenoate hydratase
MTRAALALAALLLAAPARAACPEEAAVEALARSVLANRPAQPLAGMTSLADGQCAQDRLVRALVPHLGRPVGYKVGLTNPAAQASFGVPHPLTGVIYESTVRLRSGAEVPANFAAVPRVEADLLVRVRDESINSARTPMEVLRALDQVIPFIELPDLVLASGMNGPNLLAINVGARLGVVGEPIAVEATEEFAQRLAAMTVTLHADERELARAPGSALLGHPLNVLPWLAQDLTARGQRLRAGDLVSLGGFSPALPVEAGRTYVVRYEGLVPGQSVAVSVRAR